MYTFSELENVHQEYYCNFTVRQYNAFDIVLGQIIAGAQLISIAA